MKAAWHNGKPDSYTNIRMNKIAVVLHRKTTPENLHFCQVHDLCPPETRMRSTHIEAWIDGARTVIERQLADKEVKP